MMKDGMTLRDAADAFPDLLEQERIGRWVFTRKELDDAGRGCNADDEFVARPVELKLGVVVHRDGTATNRYEDGTVGVSQEDQALADYEDRLYVNVSSCEHTVGSYTVEFSDDGSLIRILWK